MLLSLCKYILIQHLRLPVSFLWTVALPTILYATFQYDVKSLTFLGSYIVFSSYAYGNAMYLINCRESGFLKCLIRGRKSLAMFSLALYLVNTTIIFFSILLFYFIVYFLDSVSLFSQLFSLMAFSPILFFISLNILNYRKESSEVYTVLNILIMLFLIVSLYDGEYGYLINHFNPLYLYGAIAYMDGSYSYIITSVALALAGFFGIYRFSYQPVEGRA
jgi:hypothetical protein